MNENPEREAFLRALRNALLNLYDPARLRASPLVALVGLDKRHDPILALRQLLLDAVQALRPAASVPLQAIAWRLYQVLTYRYVEQSSARSVAATLGLSERQLRRAERDAEELLADFLWLHYDVTARAEALLRPATASAGPDASASLALAPDHERELEWLRQSFPSETTNIAEIIQGVVKIVAPLLQASGVQVSCELDLHLAPVTGPLSAIRQGLLNLVTAAAHAAPGGRIHLSVAGEGRHVRLQVQASGTGVAAPEASIVEELEMARQFSDLLGGSLETTRDESHPLSATLHLPVIEQVSVLVIDDNADTLRLLQRYLAGSRYRFTGLRDPEQAFEVIETCHPQIIVLDVMLPHVDDWEMLGRLRTHPATQAIPIIICTILPQKELALALGASAFLRKPVSRQELLSALDQRMEQIAPESN